jgi:uncharacterized protein YbjT (DUF2867 family)
MILVSGGTGLVGSEIVTELRRRGETVAVLGRDAAKIERVFAGSVEARTADVREPASLTEAMSGVDVVVDAVQFPTSPIELPKRGWTFEAVDYRGTVNQVDAAKAAGVRRYLYLSGTGASLDAEKHWFRYKAMAEQHLMDSGLEWTIVRPTWIYGRRDVSLNRIVGYSRFLPFVPLFGDGKNQMQPVWVEDVGRVIAEAALNPAAANQLFELGGPEVMTMNDVIKTALAVMGRRRPIFHQPIFVGKAAGTVFGVLASVLPIVPPLTADAVEFITQPATADTSNLERLLQPKLTPLRDGLATYLAK